MLLNRSLIYWQAPFGLPNDYWDPTIRVGGRRAAQDYMDYIKKNPREYDTDVIPMVCHNSKIDPERTIQNVESMCSHFRLEQSRAKQIVHFILWPLFLGAGIASFA